MSETRRCPNCKVEILDSRDKHWDTNLVCADCCSKANGCAICKMAWRDLLYKR